MVDNLEKQYNSLLKFDSYTNQEIIDLLKVIYKRDIEENLNFKFRGKTIYSINRDYKKLFLHLTTIVIDPKKRAFEEERSKRLHWILHHVLENDPPKLQVFSVTEKDAIRTYLLDEEEKYVIILEPRRKTFDAYYLIAAYCLNNTNKLESVKQKKKRQLSTVY
ncbi:MAG: hypothetical protein JSS63_13450 [Bacteroidetes bacterium]|nr:hypothetical protein [Bacteroidota bacterium]MBX7046116.1 hypothetical protein [Ignavibacteria bacterium]